MLVNWAVCKIHYWKVETNLKYPEFRADYYIFLEERKVNAGLLRVLCLMITKLAASARPRALFQINYDNTYFYLFLRCPSLLYKKDYTNFVGSDYGRLIVPWNTGKQALLFICFKPLARVARVVKVYYCRSPLASRPPWILGHCCI